MTDAVTPVSARIRDLRTGDLEEVIRLDARRTGSPKPAYWREIFRSFVTRREGSDRVGLAVEEGGVLAGYLFGEVRAFEFGSDPCGWIFAVAVDPDRSRSGLGTTLLEEAVSRFRRHGVKTVRTMVRRDDVPVMSFFRSNRFAGGSFVQLERPILEERT